MSSRRERLTTIVPHRFRGPRTSNLCDLVTRIDFSYFGLAILFAERNSHASPDLNVLDAFRSLGCFKGFLAALSFKNDPVLALVDLEDRPLLSRRRLRPWGGLKPKALRKPYSLRFPLSSVSPRLPLLQSSCKTLSWSSQRVSTLLFHGAIYPTRDVVCRSPLDYGGSPRLG
jgi:hypothetical protein